MMTVTHAVRRLGQALVFGVIITTCAARPLAAQDFGFGDTIEPERGTVGEKAASGLTGSSQAGSTVSGELEFETRSFFAEEDEIWECPIEGIPTGILKFKASGSSVEAFLKLKVTKDILSNSPEDMLDEAYVRLFIGSTTLDGGLLKVTWGKADSQGPLDVLNPFDFTDLTVTEPLERKIAVPMLHATLGLGDNSKLELAFLPGFEGDRIAWDGRWAPLSVTERKSQLAAYGVDVSAEENVLDYSDMSSLENFQGGLRLTTTLRGRVDLGAQYFYGYLPTPAVVADPAAIAALISYGTALPVRYNRYNQVGFDAAAVIAGFNLRAEAAADITKDSDGEDPLVYNSSILWSLGFDRDILSNINLNLQGSGCYRLSDDGVSTLSYDIETGTDRTRTRITTILSQKLFNDKLEWKVKGLYDIEDEDYFLLPSLNYEIGDANAELVVGVFGGDSEGELGQYADSSYVSLGLSYQF